MWWHWKRRHLFAVGLVGGIYGVIVMFAADV
jgi:hypothetical protein